jgi:hypothetical protein
MKLMGEAWLMRRPPRTSGVGVPAVWHGRPTSAGQLAGMRRQLRAALRSRGVLGDADSGERLMLAFEELVSNGLRHGRPPVAVVVTAVRGGWLLEVSDAAIDRPPAPAVDRDPAEGGMGLGMVTHTCGAHGWAVDGDRKNVWALIDDLHSLPGRATAASERARGLAARLIVTATRLAATRDGLAVEAATRCQPEGVRRHRAAADRARQVAEQARRASLPAFPAAR